MSGVKCDVLEQNRNEIIRARYNSGEGLSGIARDLGISPQRVYQIVNRNRN